MKQNFIWRVIRTNTENSLRPHSCQKKKKKKVYIFLPIKTTPSSGCCWATQSQHWTSVMSTTGLVLKPSVARLKWHLAMMAEGSCLSLQHCSTACCAAKIASIALEGHMLHSSCSISTCWTSVTLPAEFKVQQDCAYLANFGKRIHELVLVPVRCTMASYKRCFWQTTEHTQ